MKQYSKYAWASAFGWCNKRVLEALKASPLGCKEYLSYSGLKRAQQELLTIGEFVGSPEAFAFGTEYHQRVLEPEIEETHQGDKEGLILEMVKTTKGHEWLGDILLDPDTVCEDFLTLSKFGGYLDIHNPTMKLGIDLKTTSVVTEAAFLKTMYKYDYFMQAYIYLLLGGLDNFYFFGISKKRPERSFVIDVMNYKYDLLQAGKRVQWILEAKNIYDIKDTEC